MNKRADGIADTPGFISKEDSRTSKANSKKAVFIYGATLLAVVLFFILLSYFIQQRNNSQITTLLEKNATAQQNLENLQNANLQLQTQNDKYTVTIEDLENKIAALELQIDGVRQTWAEDVKNVEDTYKAQYNELLIKYNELVEKYGVEEDTND
jgi:peptidoglycan hydrolase CwlO-like protein